MNVENWAHLICLIYRSVGVFALVQQTGSGGHNLARARQSENTHYVMPP